MSFSDQALCFMAGANSIFSSETRVMLTKAVPSPDYDADKAMLDVLGLTMRPPFKDGLPDYIANGEQQGAATAEEVAP
jgi:biotin synthase